nr:RhuM family protein [Phascolarctobacterium succinatutens]
MGLTTWKNAPDGRILKSDVIVAKNYLDEKQIRQLERTVSGYFDYIEDLIERENTFTMEEFASSVNEFLASVDMIYFRIMVVFLVKMHMLRLMLSMRYSIKHKK